jgi:hypothetical protein
MSYRTWIAFCAMIAIGLSLTACKKSAETSVQSPSVSDTSAVMAGHSHEGWWCAEHSVPEEVCAQCNTKLVAEFKAKGDWCEAHNRPESQCFICHPEKEAEFAALYEAKYGTQPPKPVAESGEPGPSENANHT